MNGVPEDLLIRRLDPASDADMDGFQDVYAAAELAEDPQAALYSRADGIAMLTSDTATLFDAFGAFLGDRMVAESVLMGSRRDNLDTAQVLLWVHPACRRQGIGTRVLAHLEEHARSVHGRSVIHVQARVGGRLEANRRFAERHGYHVAMIEVERRLTFPVDLDLVDRLAAESAPHHRGYEIRGFVGSVPAELRPSYVDVRNLLGVEAPHGDMQVEPGQATVADCLRVLDALDGPVLHDAVDSATEADVEDVRLLAERLEASWGTPRSAAANWALHARIAQITPNELLRSLYTNLVDYIIEEELEGATAPTTEERLRTHLDFAAAIVSHDHELATSALERHRGSPMAAVLP